MKYTKEGRLEIGKKIYEGKISCEEAAETFGISPLTAKSYMRLYRNEYCLPQEQSQSAERDGILSALSDEDEFNALIEREIDYQVILELSDSFPVVMLCQAAGIPKSSFYNWKRSRKEKEK